MLDVITHLDSVYQTGDAMRDLCTRYAGDLGPWLDVPFLAYYKHVCRLPYIPDPVNVETVSRPAYTLTMGYGPRDCDDKAVLLGSWLYKHGEPLRFVASSTRKDGRLHHTFVQLENGLFLDGTYPKNQNYLGFYPFFRKVTRIVALTDFF